MQVSYVSKWVFASAEASEHDGINSKNAAKSPALLLAPDFILARIIQPLEELSILNNFVAVLRQPYWLCREINFPLPIHPLRPK